VSFEFLAYRVLSVFLGATFVPLILSTLTMLTNPAGTGLSSYAVYISVILYILIPLLVWRFSPWLADQSKLTSTSSSKLSSLEVLRLSLVIIGIYILTLTVPSIFAKLALFALQEAAIHPISLQEYISDGSRLLIGLILIIYPKKLSGYLIKCER